MKRMAFVFSSLAVLVFFTSTWGILSCGGSGSSTTAPTGTLSIALTDAPVDDLNGVVITISKLILKQESEEAVPLSTEAETGDIEVVFSPPKSIELSDLTGAISFPLLQDYNLPAGTYDLIRAVLAPDGCYVFVGEGEQIEKYPLEVQANYKGEPALLWIGSFTVVDGQSLDLTIDYDLRMSVAYKGSGAYMLKPFYRIVETELTGSIEGVVDSSLLSADSNPYIYVFDGEGVIPDDYDSDADDPVTSVPVDKNTGAYEVGFLPEGAYTLAFTADGASDDPEEDDWIELTVTSEAAVEAGGKAKGNIPDDAGGGGMETVGNNLSLPVIWADGISKALRGTYEVPRFEGNFVQIDEVKWYPQQDENNEWQAESFTPEGPVNVAWVDWGDNLEAKSWYETSVVRVETVLLQDISAAPMNGFEMKWLAGEGPSEVWGTNTEQYESDQATVYSGCARLTIQKLQKAREDLLPGDLSWDAGEGQWTGYVDPPSFNSAVWEAVEGPESPSTYSAEVNVGGKVIYGYNWKLRNIGEGPGDYRLTFSLDAACEDNTSKPLNTFLTESQVWIDPEEETVKTLEDSGEPDLGGGVAAIDPLNNLSYIDVSILERSGGGGGDGRKNSDRR